MKYVCDKCHKLTSEKEIIHIPFHWEENATYFCPKCYKEWVKPL